MVNKNNISFLLLAILLLTFPVNAANENQNQHMGIKPDSPFYFFQGVSEGFTGLFRGRDPVFHEELAMRRQSEIQYLRQQGKEELIEKRRLQERYQEHIQKAEQARERERNREENREDAAEKGEIERNRNRTEGYEDPEQGYGGQGSSGSGQGGL